MGTVRVEYGIDDLASVRCRASLVATHTDMVALHELLSGVPQSGIIQQLTAGIGAAITLAEQVFSSGDVESLAPDPPSDVTVTIVGRNVLVEWGEVLGADSYVIRAGINHVTQNTNAESVVLPELLFENVAYGKTYYFRVSAVQNGIEGEMGLERDVYIPYPVPAAPSLTGTVVDGTVDLDWGSVQYAAVYGIYMDGGLVIDDIPGTHHTGAMPAGSHVFTVVARNDSGSSSHSNEVVLEG